MCISNWRLSKVLRFAFYACFLLAVTCQLASAQEVKEFTKDELYNAFTTYISSKVPPVRGDFETLEAYQKRSPKPIDPTRLYGFPMCVLPRDLHKNYAYDMEKQCLTVFAGCRYNYVDAGHLEGVTQESDFIGDRLPLEIGNVITDHHSFIGQNSYGAKTVVDFCIKYDLVLNIDNYKNIPDTIIERRVSENNLGKITDTAQKRVIDGFDDYDNLSLFYFAIPMSTAKAQVLVAQGIETICYVHLHSYQESTSYCSNGHDATIADPTADNLMEDIINATLVKIVVRSSKTKEVLAQYDIPAVQEKPPVVAPAQQPWDK